MNTPTLTREEVLAALGTLKANGLRFADCFDASRARTTDELAYVEQARADHQRDGEIEIDDGAVVSKGDDAGAYVMAWLWVADRDIWQGDTDTDGEPCRTVNHYYCSSCAESWTDTWSCACNDHCPVCEREIEPDSSDELDLHGELVASPAGNLKGD